MPLDLRLALPDDGQLAGNAVNIKCREHKDRVQSLSVYPGNIHCHGCGFHLVGLKALAYLLKVDLDEALKVEARYTTESLDAYRERAAEEARRDPLPFALAKAYNSLMFAPGAPRAHRFQWYAERGLTPETCERFHLGHDGLRFTIPVCEEDGSLVSIRYRRDDAFGTLGPKYSGIKGRNGLYLFGADRLASDRRQWVVVCEGELDAIRLWQEGYAACSPTNGAGQVPKVPAMLRERFPRIRCLILATDRDERGDWAAEEGRKEALALGFQVIRLTWDDGFKDVTEALAAGCRLRREESAHAA